MTNVHQCPACELRFRNRTELEYHWAEDHPPPAGEPVEVAGGDPVTADVESALGDLEGWSVAEGAVVKQYTFSSFPAAIDFVQCVAGEAEDANHHPDIDIRYNKVRIALVTHSAGGITSKDLDMARRIEEVCPPRTGP